MEEKRSMNKSLMVVSLLLLSVVAVLIVLFVFRPTEKHEGIQLPASQSDPGYEGITEMPMVDNFVQIDRENVISVLESLERPEYYHQTYDIQIGSGRNFTVRHLELWVNGPWIHAEIRDEIGVKSIFTDGQIAWIWHERDLTPMSFQLSEDLLLEDLLGLPNFDYQNKLKQSERLESGYAYDEEAQLQYIYVRTQNQKDSISEYRFSLESGLLYSCEAQEGTLRVYNVIEKSFDRLAYGDQAFDGRFCLPDGTVPFTAETRMLQP